MRRATHQPSPRPRARGEDRTWPGAALAALLAVAATGCTSVSAKGIVQGTDGRPVKGATLTLRPGDPDKTPPPRSSEPNGCFNVFATADGKRPGLLRVEAPGYKPLDLSVPPARENLLLVTLVPAAAVGGSSARPLTPEEKGPVYLSPCEPDVRGNAITLR